MKGSTNEIKKRWNLPKVYMEFLAKHPKKGKFIEGKDFVNGLNLYGASELIRGQDGYSYNPIEKQPIDDWPKDYVVIADDGADPYVLDLSRCDGKDAPVLFSYHGQGKWSFRKRFASFTEFIERLNSN